MKTFALTLVTIVLVGTVSLVTGCSRVSETNLVGKWCSPNDTNSYVQFAEDGSVIIEERGTSHVGRFVYIDEQNMRVEFDGQTNSAGVSLLSNGEMIFDRGQGRRELLRRAK